MDLNCICLKYSIELDCSEMDGFVNNEASSPPELFLPVIEEIYGNYNLDQGYRVCSQVWSLVNTLFLPQTL